MKMLPPPPQFGVVMQNMSKSSLSPVSRSSEQISAGEGDGGNL